MGRQERRGKDVVHLTVSRDQPTLVSDLSDGEYIIKGAGSTEVQVMQEEMVGTVLVARASKKPQPVRVRVKARSLVSVSLLLVLSLFVTCITADRKRVALRTRESVEGAQLALELPGANCGDEEVVKSLGPIDTEYVHNEICRVILTVTGTAPLTYVIETGGYPNERIYVAGRSPSPMIVDFRSWMDDSDEWEVDTQFYVMSKTGGHNIGDDDHGYQGILVAKGLRWRVLFSASHYDDRPDYGAMFRCNDRESSPSVTMTGRGVVPCRQPFPEEVDRRLLPGEGCIVFILWIASEYGGELATTDYLSTRIAVEGGELVSAELSENAAMVETDLPRSVRFRSPATSALRENPGYPETPEGGAHEVRVIVRPTTSSNPTVRTVTQFEDTHLNPRTDSRMSTTASARLIDSGDGSGAPLEHPNISIGGEPAIFADGGNLGRGFASRSVDYPPSTIKEWLDGNASFNVNMENIPSTRMFDFGRINDVNYR